MASDLEVSRGCRLALTLTLTRTRTLTLALTLTLTVPLLQEVFATPVLRGMLCSQA